MANLRLVGLKAHQTSVEVVVDRQAIRKAETQSLVRRANRFQRRDLRGRRCRRSLGHPCPSTYFAAFSRSTVTEFAGKLCTKLEPALLIGHWVGATLVGCSTVFSSSGWPVNTVALADDWTP